MWQELDPDSHRRVWNRFDGRFDFLPSAHPEDWPSIVEPTPSLTWDLAPGQRRPLSRYDHAARDFGRSREGVDELADVLFAALKRCTGEQDWVYVLDWQHASYRFWPHRTDSVDPWPVPIVPDGDYCAFLAADLSYGIFGHPWERTVCLFGGELTTAVADHGQPVLRRDGRAPR
ncbi:DUF2716 domain-containing protein [Allokutzneria oryzae]|uniref:DUF2716 domain-containing protein n=1 Tax=Allokutzneria oryzae TaxID=1378989 RepID=A0ABV6A3K2_9PSEU